MRKYIVVVMMATILAAMPAYATDYFCQGTVTFLAADTAGNIVVAGPGGLPSVYLCSTGTTSSNGITPDGCKAAYAILLAAKTSGQQVRIYITDSLTCSTQPAWSTFVHATVVSTL